MQKKIFVTRSSMPGFEEYCEEIRDIWDSRWLTNMGAKHAALENALKEYLSVPNVTLFTNGHLALESAIACMGLPEGAEVITTPFTFVSTTHAIARNRLKPVFCDIDPKDFTIDCDTIESLITGKTAAILPVHVYGNVCDVERIEEIAKKHNLKVIYDAAHTFGVRYKEQGIGTFGDISMFSFHATKVFNTIEGGAAVYKNASFSQKLNDLKNFAIRDIDVIEGIGGNAKMNEFQAAMGICNLRHVDEEIAKRKHAAERYREHLSGVKGIYLPQAREGVLQNYAYFPVVFDSFKSTRDEVYDTLAQNEIYARKYFYPLTSNIACYTSCRGAKKDSLPVANHIADSVLTLPMFADLQDEDIDRICDLILN